MGLRENDLQDLIVPMFEIDSYKSKMGSDKDICVMSFNVLEKAAADDLVQFIESGYNFVLDADATSGEQADGYYRVFVEMEREEGIAKQIIELADGVSRLTGGEFKYRYYKGFKPHELTIESLQDTVPTDAESYDELVNESNLNNFKNFFSNSYVDDIFMEDENDLIVKKMYADPLGFKVKDFGSTTEILESIEEKINMNDYAEILFLTKYLGDYNISKFGDKTITLEQADKMLVVERL
jgi:hypothetical protein